MLLFQLHAQSKKAGAAAAGAAAAGAAALHNNNSNNNENDNYKRVKKGVYSLVDPTTPFHQIPASIEGEGYKLVYSDEFNVTGRSFADGFDPVWTALDKNDYTNAALHYYKPEAVTTANGTLQIRTYRELTAFSAEDIKSKKTVKKNKYYTSGMLQSWNKLCYTGGVMEIRARLPGNAFTGGLWPAAWTMGNLARATYVQSSDYMWPWSYDKCNRKEQNGQELSGCNEVEHWGVGRGRGAPEIDIIEGMGGENGKLPNTKMQKPYVSTSLQVSPGIREGRPVLGNLPREGRWYEGMKYGKNTTLNNFFYGVLLSHKPTSYSYQSDAISANTRLKATHFEDFHRYRMEWRLPTSSEQASIRWYLDDEFLFSVSQENLKISGSKIPDEPMYMLLNTAISSTWGFPAPLPPDCECTSFDCDDDKVSQA